MMNNNIGLILDLTQRVLNAKTLADGLYDSIMDENNIESDAPLSLTIMLQEQLGFIEKLVDDLDPHQPMQLVEGGEDHD